MVVETHLKASVLPVYVGTGMGAMVGFPVVKERLLRETPKKLI